MDKRLHFIETTWSNDLAYVVGIITSDGNLSPDGRHINVTSKDKEIIKLVKKILGLNNKIGRKGRGYTTEKRYFVIQFGSKNFYAFLLNIGLTPAKSKTIRGVLMPDLYFADFVRGCFDGDGNINEALHPESKHTQLKVRFSSASPAFLSWLLKRIQDLYRIRGGSIYVHELKSVGTLSFGKEDAIKLLRAMYKTSNEHFLKRKYRIAKHYLGG